MLSHSNVSTVSQGAWVAAEWTVQGSIPQPRERPAFRIHCLVNTLVGCSPSGKDRLSQPSSYRVYSGEEMAEEKEVGGGFSFIIFACHGEAGSVTIRLQSRFLQGLKKSYLLGFPVGSVVKNLPANAEDRGSILDLGRSHRPWSNKAHAPQLLHTCSRAQEATTTEPTCHNY